MAILKNRLLFFTTSPRTPAKMIPEIKLLTDNFAGRKWDKISQEEFIEQLAESEFFEGRGSPTDKAFSARDRITRAPKSLGLVDLKPKIELTMAGKAFLNGPRPREIFLKQLLKFQLPSPYHIEDASISGTFFIRPYLEILRLIYDLNKLSFDELKIFGLQLTNYKEYISTKDKIISFRNLLKNSKGNYKRLVNEVWERELSLLYYNKLGEVDHAQNDSSAARKKFIDNQKSNARDYADALFRYLRYTELVSLSYKSLFISEYKHNATEYILQNIPRDPIFINDEIRFKEYLFSDSNIILYDDVKENLIDSIIKIGGDRPKDCAGMDVRDLKNYLNKVIKTNKDEKIIQETNKLKSYANYQDVMDTFARILSGEFYDAPLMLEYNVWRAMTMLNGGIVKGNFKLDDSGAPLSTAAGNIPDIECHYDNFNLSIEVTLQSGQRQYETEGEPVARHYGNLKRKYADRETYCVFIAPKINNSALAHFYGLNKVRIAMYGGKSNIIPLELNQFLQLVRASREKKKRPGPDKIKSLLECFMKRCRNAKDEIAWKEAIQTCVDNWLN